jgi:CheY-like chemotaxis protein
LDTFDFSRLGVLLVEDNNYIRVTLENVLRQFRFGRLESVNDGQQAVEYMKTVGTAGTNNPPDIIISDLVMTPINGLLFLRWVRTSKESVNRMIPFIMLSGAADEKYVNSARDLGCNEFMAKPFSVDTVYKHLLKLIERPRQFVTTTTYFGPDRRRQKPDTPMKERRLKEEDDVTIVYSAEKVVKPKAPTDVWYFRLPNKLKEKAGGAGFKGAAEMPMDLLQEAEEQLERAALDFTTWAQDYLKRLLDICVDALLEESERSKYFAEINLLALELRGQGGTFGYPLIFTLGKMLYDATVEGCPKDNNAVEIVKAHIDAMRAVLREKISGEGGEVGRALLESLNQAIASK